MEARNEDLRQHPSIALCSAVGRLDDSGTNSGFGGYEMSTQREVSKQDWNGANTIENINSGSLQRIADATEKMASNYLSMERDRDNYKRWYEREVKKVKDLNLSNAALRGVITKLKSAKDTK
jgi:molecular chaperone GrpE (heat shock protein)